MAQKNGIFIKLHDIDRKGTLGRRDTSQEKHLYYKMNNHQQRTKDRLQAVIEGKKGEIRRRKDKKGLDEY